MRTMEPNAHVARGVPRHTKRGGGIRVLDLAPAAEYRCWRSNCCGCSALAKARDKGQGDKGGGKIDEHPPLITNQTRHPVSSKSLKKFRQKKIDDTVGWGKIETKWDVGKVSPGVISHDEPRAVDWPLYLWAARRGVTRTNRPLPRGRSSRPMVARLVRYGPVRQKKNFSR